jgi:hypothetical protein
MSNVPDLVTLRNILLFFKRLVQSNLEGVIFHGCNSVPYLHFRTGKGNITLSLHLSTENRNIS